MKTFIFTLLFLAFNATAQGLMKCTDANGKIGYADRCDNGSGKEIAPKQMDDKAGKERVSALKKDEDAFQKRHAEREKLAANERNSKRRAAVQNAEIDLKREKLELAKLKEKRLSKEKKKSPKAPKSKTATPAKSTP